MAPGGTRRRDYVNYPLVRNADRAQIIAALGRLSVTSDGDWLRASNVYATMAAVRIERDGYAISHTQFDDFAEYLAASSFVHCGDAWSYLGRAIDALIRGDVHSAVHLTYYAELRGAIALLGTEGVYIGNFFSCSLTSSRNATLISTRGTHAAVWRCLEKWNKSPRSTTLFGSVLRPGGVDLNAWSSNLVASSIRPVIDDLLGRMKFDLQTFQNDRERRNDVSYNPSRLVVDDMNPEVVQRILTNLWSVLEPDAPGTFPILDQTLLMNVLASTFGSTHKKIDEGGNATNETDWTNWEVWVDALVPPQALSTSMHDALLEVPTSNPVAGLLSSAFTDVQGGQRPSDHLEGMLTRTMILLRLATGSCLQLMAEAGVSRSEVAPWVNALGLSRGLWSVAEEPDDKLDLWIDSQLALDDLAAIESTDSFGLLEALRPHLIVLGQFERVTTWSFS